MTEKRFIPVFTGYEPHRLIGAKDNGKIITFEEMFDLLNFLSEENERLKQTNQRLNDELQETMGYLALKSCVEKENEQLKKEVEMLRNGLKAYDEALPLYLDCEDIMHFNNRELFEFQMEQMDFYKKYPNRVHYK